MCLFDVHHKLEAHCDGAYVIWSIQRKFSRALNPMTMMMVMIMTMMTMMMMMMMMEMEMQLYPQSPADGVTAPLGVKQLSGLWGKTMMMMMMDDGIDDDDDSTKKNEKVTLNKKLSTTIFCWTKNYFALTSSFWGLLSTKAQKLVQFKNRGTFQRRKKYPAAFATTNTISKMSMERNLVKKNSLKIYYFL